MPKVLVGVPCMDKVDALFCKSLRNLEVFDDTDFEFKIRLLVYSARDKICKKAVNEGYDYVFFLDDDMTFEPDTLKRLLAHDKDVVTGLCFQRGGKHLPCVFDKKCQFVTTWPNELFEIGYCGGACVLIKTKVLKKVLESERTCFRPLPGLGEDLSFCKRAKKCGFTLYCDPTVKPGHITTYEITEKDYEG